MNTTLSCPYPTLPIFVVCMKNDGRYMRSFFADSCHITDAGCILPGVKQMVEHLNVEASHTVGTTAGTGTNHVVLGLESFLGHSLQGDQPFAWFTVNYDDIRTMTTMSNAAGPSESSTFITWLVENQFPVIHLVRKNPLGCFVDELIHECDQMSQDDVPILDLMSAVSTIRQMQTDVEEFRNRLVPTNRIEFYSESLFGKDQKPSDLVVHQLGKHLGISVDKLATTDQASKPKSDDVLAAQIKSQLRPALIRAGYENLYDHLPRAA